MNSLPVTSTEEVIFKDDEKTLIQHNLRWNLLRCVTIDSKNICGALKGIVVQIVLSAGTLQKVLESIMCYKTSSVNSELHLFL